MPYNNRGKKTNINKIFSTKGFHFLIFFFVDYADVSYFAEDTLSFVCDK